jgi:MFS transporter, ACS family, tartrate transporter
VAPDARGSDASVSVTVAAADRTRRQVAIRLLPFLFILYVINYLDRTNIAYAALGMSRDLGFSDSVFGLGAGILFISYVTLQIPATLLVERWSARGVIGGSLIACGAVTASIALVHTSGQLYLARFLLGAAEAGYFPGVVVYLTHWFIREDRAKAGSNFMAAIPVSFVIGSPLSGWILGHYWLRIVGWRWVFVLEGLPAVLLGVVALFYITDWPHEAHWLAAGQRQWIEEKLEEEKPRARASATTGRILRSRTVVMLCSVAFLGYFTGYTFGFWYPTMLKRWSALSDARVGWLGALPYAVAFVVMLVNGWDSDRTGERHWHAAAPMFVAASAVLGLICWHGSTTVTIVWFALAAMTNVFLPTFWTIPPEVLPRSAIAAAVGLVNAVGNVAGFAGPYVFGYLTTRTGSFSYGLALLMIAGVLSGVLILLLPKSAQQVKLV